MSSANPHAVNELSRTFMAKPKRAALPEGVPAKKQRTAGQKFARVAAWAGVLAVGMIAIGVAAFAVIFAGTPVPDPNKDFQTNVTTVYYADGKKEMGSFAVHNRVSIPLDEMPQHAKDAIVAAENATFWTDPGISVSGIAGRWSARSSPATPLAGRPSRSST